VQQDLQTVCQMGTKIAGHGLKELSGMTLKNRDHEGSDFSETLMTCEEICACTRCTQKFPKFECCMQTARNTVMSR
jgi:hypothetical protein